MRSPEKLLKDIQKELVRLHPERPELRHWNPVIAMAEVAADERVATPVRYAAMAEVAKYTQPKPAAVDSEGNVAPVLEVRIAGYAQGAPRAINNEVRALSNGKGDE